MKNENLKKHKESFEYKAGQLKYSAIIWTVGSGVISLSLWAAFFNLRRTMILREVITFFAIMVTWRFVKKLRMWYFYRDASVGVALGINTDKRFLKNIRKAQAKLGCINNPKKAKKLKVKIEWWKNYLSKEGKEELKKEIRPGGG